MKPEELWVICDMLGEPARVPEALDALDKGLASDSDLGNDSTIYIGPSPPERFAEALKKSGLKPAEQIKLVSTLTGNLTDALKSKDAQIAKRVGHLLMLLARVSAILVGSDPLEPMPTQREANRAMSLLSQIAETAIPLNMPRPDPPPGRSRRAPEREGGIFTGGIFGPDDGDY